MPVRGSRLIKFCVQALDSDRYPNFKWVDKELRIFILMSVHKRSKMWRKEFLQIFKDYVNSCKRKCCASSVPQLRFIAALNKSKFLQKLETDGKDRIYKICAEECMSFHQHSSVEEMDCDSGFSSGSDSVASPGDSHVSVDSPLPCVHSPLFNGEPENIGLPVGNDLQPVQQHDNSLAPPPPEEASNTSSLLPSFGIGMASEKLASAQITNRNEVQEGEDELFQDLDNLLLPNFDCSNALTSECDGKMDIEKIMETYGVSKDDSFDMAMPAHGNSKDKLMTVTPTVPVGNNPMSLHSAAARCSGLGYVAKASNPVAGQMGQRRILVLILHPHEVK